MGRTLKVLGLVFALIVAALPAGAAPNGGPTDVVPAARLTDADGDRISDGLGGALAMADPGARFDVVVTWSGPPDIARAERAAGKLAINRHFGVVDGFSATMTAAQIRALSRVPSVFRIEENFQVAVTMDEATLEYGTDEAIADFGVDGSGVTVCVLDTGVDPNHEQLDSQLIGFFDSINGQSVAYDDHGHGSHVASILLGDGQGTSADAARYRGVAPGASLLAGKVLSAAGSGTEAQIIAGIDWCVAQGADVMSMSLGTSTGSDGLDALSQAVNNAVDSGVISVIAAGNAGDGPESVGSPGAAAQAITVGASSKVSDGPYLAPFSSRGPNLAGLTKPDIVSPGVAITAADANTGTGYASYSGTSMATPFAAGTIALALERDPLLSSTEIKTNLAATAIDLGVPGPDNNWGAGLLDAYSFVDLADGATGGTAIALPARAALADVVADNGLWTHTFSLGADDLGSPITAGILIDGTLECTLSLFGICFIWEWSPDLDARMIDPNGQTLWLSECPLSGDCGSTGQQETIHVMPTVAGDYRLEVFPFAGNPNNGTGGAFWVDLFSGPVAGSQPQPNNPPVAVDDSATTDEDITIEVAVLSNDSDPDAGDVLSIVSVTDPLHGTAQIVGDAVSYAPNTDFNGSDSFEYTIADGNGGTDTAAVTVAVAPVNDPPSAADDAYAVDEDATLVVDAPGILTNDTDPDGDALTASGSDGPSDGSLALNGDGSFTYLPDPDFNGTDSFTYAAADGNGGTATATVTILVNAINDPPTAGDDAASTQAATPVVIDVLANDGDVDADQLTVTAVTEPADGTATINTDGTVTYLPDVGFTGSDQFDYEVSDGHGGTASATVSVLVVAAPASLMHVGDLDGSASPVARGKWSATVTITVHDQNEVPLAGATVWYSWSDGTTGTCTTDGSGICLATNTAKKRLETIDLTIDDVGRVGFTYAPSVNHDSDLDSDGTTITVAQ